MRTVRDPLPFSHCHSVADVWTQSQWDAAVTQCQGCECQRNRFQLEEDSVTCQVTA